MFSGRLSAIMDELVGAVTDGVGSADCRTPGGSTAAETATALQGRGATTVVTTAGPDPISWWDSGRRGEIAVPPVRAVDTLGAGDVFHGAYAYALAAGADIEQRLRYAADVAAIRCSMVGPRSWVSAVAGVTLGARGR